MGLAKQIGARAVTHDRQFSVQKSVTRAEMKYTQVYVRNVIVYLKFE
jgi:hypothetical protein